MKRLNSPKSVLAIVTLCHAINHMYQGMLPFLYTPILLELGLSYTQLGLIISIHMFAMGIMQFGSSILSRYIPKQVLLGLGNILLGLGNFVVGLSQGFVQFLFGRLIAAVGGSPQHPVGTALIAERFDEKARGSALGAHFSFAFIGNILGPLAAGVFLIYLGWRSTLHILMIPAFVIGIIAIFLIKEYPSTLGEVKSSSVMNDLKKLFSNRSIAILFLAQLFASSAGQGVLINYTPVILSDSLGLEPESSERLFFYVMFLVGGVVGPIGLGRLSDFIGRNVTGIITAILTSFTLYLTATISQSSIIMVPILIVLGANAFSLSIIIQAIITDLTSGTMRDIALGMYYTLTFTFSSVWVFAVGYFADLNQTFTPIMIAASISVMLTSIFLYFGSKG